MNTFFGIIQNNVAILNEDESLHCVKVLRHKVGDIIQVIDGNGTRAIGKIEAAHAKQCAVSLSEKEVVKQTRQYKIHIAIAPTKNIERIEWFVEKAVEIGVDEISFIKCKNSERTVIKDDRLKKVAEAAVKQSQQAYIPKLNSLVDYKEFIKKDTSDIKLIAHCEKESKQHLKQYITSNKSYTILIGPEGDFTKDEIAIALSTSYIPVALGDTRLRTETAGLFACNALAVINS
ncbi:MAG: 16S rRNA (uracil(1498)-N(3))-methyltransferase [Sphingobacteriaceae bacterium]|nr:16S rRNA (uracil(1498)-N(3))-methyltransferase [Sphingobacteriaceae bacterium]